METAVSARLLALEQLDSRLAAIEQSLAEARKLHKDYPGLSEARAALDATRERASSLAAQQRALEVELAEIEQRKTRDERRMYGGQIVDPRELTALEHEIAHHRERQRLIEDQLLAVMEDSAKSEEMVEDEARLVDELTARWRASLPGLESQEQQATESVATLRADRGKLAGEIDARSLALYTALRSTSGHAVSIISDGVCQWCRVTIPARDIQHAHAGALVTCSNCGRVLAAQ
ncbi:MAG: zinc ribbon domain-containing protein [Chloroflexota bacterium]